jgi:hypothetical protein
VAKLANFSACPVWIQSNITNIIIKKYEKKQPRKVLKQLKIVIKEKRKDLGKRTGHYFDELNRIFHLLKITNKTFIEFGFRQISI